MSLVTNIILTSFHEGPVLAEVNRYFQEAHDTHTRGPGLVDVSNLAGGTKYMEMDVWLGAFNYLRLEPFCEHLRGVKWAYPESVVMFVREQHDDRCREYPWR